MEKLIKARNYIIVKTTRELELAKNCPICSFIIWEQSDVIYLYERLGYKWTRKTYIEFSGHKEKDETVTGLSAYTSFYRYCGKEEVERMKHIFPLMEKWESCEQLRYCNINYAGIKMNKPIYVFDANSAFTYGVTQLPNDFKPLKEYMLELYNNKRNAKDSITRSKYKNLQNYLIGYFSRVKEFVSLRSEIIRLSNFNIEFKMIEIRQNGGEVYLSNTDSIVTDEVGATIMNKYKGDDVGQFKIEQIANKLFYRSSNIYQIGNKIAYSGVGYFARKEVDLFKDIYATQKGKFINGYEFDLDTDDNEEQKICRISFDKITIIVKNSLEEVIKIKHYIIGDNND